VVSRVYRAPTKSTAETETKGKNKAAVETAFDAWRAGMGGPFGHGDAGRREIVKATAFFDSIAFDEFGKRVQPKKISRRRELRHGKEATRESNS
jgi:hypothetical protein